MTNLLQRYTYSLHTKPEKLIVMLHGYGDNAENFINVANFIDKEEWGAYYLSLEAPHSIPNFPTGNQWLDIYPNGKYISEAGPEEIIVVRNEVENALKQIELTINYYLKRLILKHKQCMIIGFSQGGIMAFEFGNYFQEQLGALAIVSGRIMQKDKINNLSLKKIPIFISHGNKDDILDINNFYQSIDYLKKNNFNFESHEIIGDTHTISLKAINLLQQFIKKNL